MFVPISDDNPLRYLKRPYALYCLIGVMLVFYIPIGWDKSSSLSQDLFYSLGMIPAVLFGYSNVDTTFFSIPVDFTLITYIFMHGGLAHIAGNLAFFWVFGDNIEDAMGHWRFLMFFLLTGLCGGLLHAIMDPTSPVPLVGASGAVSGMIAAYLMLFPFVKSFGLVLGWLPLRIPSYIFLLAWVFYQVVALLFMTDGQIGWWAHLGGFISGLILVVFFKRKSVKLFSRQLPLLRFPTNFEASSISSILSPKNIPKE